MRKHLPGPIDRLVFPADIFEPESSPKHMADDGVVANSRLTAGLGALLVVLFGAVGITLLNTRGWIDWHAGLGIAAGVVVVPKLASTGYRMLRYYSRNGRYVASGPPRFVMRVLAPFLVLTTVLLIGTGVLAIYFPRTIWKEVHGFFFWTWIFLAAAHVLVYFWRLPRVITAPRGAEPRWRGSPALTWLIIILTLVAAIAIAWWFVGQMPQLPAEMHHGHHDG